METLETPLVGACACGAVKFTVSAVAFGIVNCHCEDCLRLHGNYNAMVAVPKAALAFTTDAPVSRYRTSPEAERGFCPTCGSQLFKLPGEGPVTLVSAGALQGPLRLRTRKNVWTEDAPDWYDVPAVAEG